MWVHSQGVRVPEDFGGRRRRRSWRSFIGFLSCLLRWRLTFYFGILVYAVRHLWSVSRVLIIIIIIITVCYATPADVLILIWTFHLFASKSPWTWDTRQCWFNYPFQVNIRFFNLSFVFRTFSFRLVSLYIYIYIYIYLYIFIYLYVFISIYTYLCVYIYIYLY